MLWNTEKLGFLLPVWRWSPPGQTGLSWRLNQMTTGTRLFLIDFRPKIWRRYFACWEIETTVRRIGVIWVVYPASVMYRGRPRLNLSISFNSGGTLAQFGETTVFAVGGSAGWMCWLYASNLSVRL